jgi:WD40 repeat protein
MQKSPFKFLDSYSKEDRDIFFGRDKEIEELHSRVFESKVLIVYGISGTGKSSIIHCGLANKFNDSDWLPVNIRRGLNINQSLADSLIRNALTKISSEKTASSKVDIVKLIRSIYLDHFKPIYLIFDQCEELFIFGNKNEKDEFINSVKRIIESDLQCRFIFSVREEYLAGFTEFEKTIPSFFANRIRIEKMTRQNALKVIEGPCQVNGIEIEPGFSSTLLEKLNPDSPDVELTYLQVYLDKIFRLASPDGKEVRRITTSLLDKVGDVKDLLGTFLEEQIAQLDDPDAGLVILKSFVSVRGTKRQITEDEVIDYSKTLGKDIDADSVKNLIQRFIKLRILRDKDENGRFELRHDSLATSIYEKITLVEKELLEVRQFIENSWNNYERRHLFLSSEDLQYIAPYEDKLFLNEKIIKFISQSKGVIHSARRRRQNVFISIASVIIIVLSFFTIWAIKERSNALDQKKIADEQKNAAFKATAVADSARKEALISQNLAVEKEKLAVISQKQSDEARKVALKESKYALDQKNRAEKLSVTANEQAQIATEEKLRAEQERSKAITAEAKSRQLGLLSTAQNLALKSMKIEKNPELMGLLAVQAYIFNRNNDGKPDDPIIYESLNKAFSELDSSKHSVFTGSPSEIWSLAEKENSFVSADLDGKISSWNNDGMATNSRNLSYLSPVCFIALNASGDKIITQHDNLDMLIWKIKPVNIKGYDFQALDRYKGFVRTLDFSKDDKYVVSGGKDSMISVWNTSDEPAVKIKSLKARSPVKSVIFCGDTIISALDDGTILLWSLENGKNQTIYQSKNAKPLCLAWNNKKGLLFAGCDDGSLMSFEKKADKFERPVKYAVHSAGIDLITFNSDFSLLATSCRDKTIKLYFYSEFFDRGNSVGGAVDIKDINSRIRSIMFTGDNKLVAGTSDRNIRIWETSSEKLSSIICQRIKRDMTSAEWNDMVGVDIPYEKGCGGKLRK